MKASKTYLLPATILGLLGLTAWMPAQAGGYDEQQIRFPLTRQPLLNEGCLPKASGTVKVRSIGNAEIMDVRVAGLSPNTEYDLFIIQVPNPPFGMSWYQGDLQTKRNGVGHARFIGRFNKETFIVAPGSTVAPQIHDSDADENPQTGPIHTYHVGIWFNSPEDAVKAGCQGITTPFNGEHNAGIQVLNTATFPDEEGPLLELEP
ncbi:hypothetical protein [Methylomonas sp. HYX-M1]|uniref:hypothetical protein n=1 Tax=Methylomonas sp. HYX-M1 TaxID=3139307 RepID=UPI00345C51C9